MHDYLLSSEWVRFAFVFGVAVSMVLYERRHLTTGSIVVPGYIAVFIIHPPVLIATFANALLTYWLVNHVLRRFFLLYGRTKFTLLAAISTVVQTILLRITPRGEWLWESDIPLFIGVGYVVPALIAHDMARQGVWKTSKSVMLAGTLVASPIAVALVLDLPGVNDLAPLDGFGAMAIEGRWLPLAVLLSVFASWAVAMNYGMRSGGFIGAAFLSMFMGDPWQVVIAVVIAALTYLIVTHVLMQHMILFGRRKFSSMLLVSSVLAWTSLWFGGRFLNEEWQQHLGLGSLALTPLLLPGLLANDAQRTAPRRVLYGVLLGGTFVLTTTWWIQSTVTGAILHPGWKLISIGAAGALFAPQLQRLLERAGIIREPDEHDTEAAPTEPVPPMPFVEPADAVAPPSARRPAATHPSKPEPVVAALTTDRVPEDDLVPVDTSTEDGAVALDEVELAEAVLAALKADDSAEPDTTDATPAHAPRGPPVIADVSPEPAPDATEATFALARTERAPDTTEPTPADSRPERAVVTPWQTWAAAHPAEAKRAESWLDAELARASSTPTLDDGPSMLDDLTRGVLESALAGLRGIAPVPRGRPRNPLASGPPAHMPADLISGASSGAREAHPAPLGVPDDESSVDAEHRLR